MSDRIAACQFEPVIGDIDANLESIRALGSDLRTDVAFAVFPELCVTGYDLETVADLATSVPGPITNSLAEIAGSIQCLLAVGLPERDGDDLFNTTVVVSGDGVEAAYRKQYPWGAEAEVFSSGEEPTTVETPVGTVGLCCCYDLNFPEVGLEYAQLGCDILAVNAAWRTSYLPDWRLLSRARARDGPFYVVASNHTGDQHGRNHAGHSLVAGPDGRIRSEGDTKNGVVSAPVTVSDLEQAHEQNPVRATRSSDQD
ncbi:carbon-nitrogen hydrolase family protein [Natronorubrum sp. A-ect3]|uniref:carbon-nitrogen hydrolase family protein n=1 Tax=Natronorubrum sp. A-ect3 TaxID=3242698 RepID=UPI00359E2A93